MADHTLRVAGREMTGSRISGPLLRDLLALVTDGTRRALRMRIEGRSAAGGPKPSWLEPGSKFDFLGLSDGSSNVCLEAPSLAQAAPASFAQGSVFVDNTQSAIDLLEESLSDALAGKADSDRYDPAMLVAFEEALERVVLTLLAHHHRVEGVRPHQPEASARDTATHLRHAGRILADASG